MLSTEVFLALAQGELSVPVARAVLHLASTQITTTHEALDAGYLACKGLGYDAASDMNPWSDGPLAQAFDRGIVEHEVSADIDLDEDSDDYSDTTDRPLSKAEGEHNAAHVTLPDPVRMTAVNILSVTSLVLFGVAAFIHFA